ncbi:MAG: MFS transporter [Thermoleophilaceae bacterium]|nr:MFS transporter [Thermoleophilaceae bacterium]
MTPPPSEDTRRWWILGGASTSLFVLMLDSTTVPLALPSIRLELGASASGLQWVQNVYLLTLAVLVIALSRLGDMIGRRRVFQLGTIAFGAGSVICATAGSVAQLIAGRAVQGAGGAALLAVSLVVANLALRPEERRHAAGVWAAASVVALLIGPVLGGAAVEFVGWRLVFWLTVPITVIALAITGFAAPVSRGEMAGPRIDFPGLLTMALGLTAVVFSLVQGEQWGWDSAATLGILAAGLGLLAALWFVEHRVREPIIDFGLFRTAPYLGATAAAFALAGSYWVVLFYLPQYLELVIGHSTFASGVRLVPVIAPMVAICPFARMLVARMGARGVMTAGMACGTAAWVVLTRVDGDTRYIELLPVLLLFGLGLGLVYATMWAAATAAMPREKAGIGSGALAMSLCLGGALLLAAGGALFQHIELERRTGGSSFDAAFADGLAGASALLAAAMAAGTLLTWLCVRGAPSAREPHRHRYHL